MQPPHEGIAECPTCGAVYRVRYANRWGVVRDGWNCFLCGERLDGLSGQLPSRCELVSDEEATTIRITASQPA